MKKFIRTPFTTAPWTKGGWVRPTTEVVSDLYQRIGNRKKILEITGWKSLRTAKTIDYSEFRFLCELAGKNTAEISYCGSIFWKGKQRDRIMNKINATRAELEQVELSLDITGLEEDGLEEALKEITLP